MLCHLEEEQQHIEEKLFLKLQYFGILDLLA